MNTLSTKHLLLVCLWLSIILLFGCIQERESTTRPSYSTWNGEYIYRWDEEQAIYLNNPVFQPSPTYPWQEKMGHLRHITKEYFRCKGNPQNPPHLVIKDGQVVHRYEDCGGSDKHGLPVYHDKEFIYPILIELLNDIQKRAQKPVVITCGHRCPQHHAYIDPSPSASNSKHQIGAAVDFYLQGLEDKPEEVLFLIQEFYKNHPRYQNRKEYIEFHRYEKPVNSLSTLPWMNKEILIKLFKSHEGRNPDNRHPYPYLSIQVRYDWENNEKILFNWERSKCYHR